MKIKDILLKSIPFLLLFSFCVGAYMEQAKGKAEIERDLTLRLALVESNVDDQSFSFPITESIKTPFQWHYMSWIRCLYFISFN